MGIVGAFVVPHPPLVVPTVGRGEERAVQKTIDAYRTVGREIVEMRPEVIVVSSPHAPMFRDAFHVTTSPRLRGSMFQFGAPQEVIDAACDVDFARSLIAQMKERRIPTVDSTFYPGDMDHGTFVPLYFVREAYAAVCKEHGVEEHVVRCAVGDEVFAAQRIGHAVDKTAPCRQERDARVAGRCQHFICTGAADVDPLPVRTHGSQDHPNGFFCKGICGHGRPVR